MLAGRQDFSHFCRMRRQSKIHQMNGYGVQRTTRGSFIWDFVRGAEHLPQQVSILPNPSPNTSCRVLIP